RCAAVLAGDGPRAQSPKPVRDDRRGRPSRPGPPARDRPSQRDPVHGAGAGSEDASPGGRGRRDGSNRGVVIRLVFMGTPEFALPSLEAALAASDVAAVVTRPDAPQGRGQRVTPPPVAAVASQYGLEVLQPASLKARSIWPACGS